MKYVIRNFGKLEISARHDIKVIWYYISEYIVNKIYVISERHMLIWNILIQIAFEMKDVSVHNILGIRVMHSQTTGATSGAWITYLS